MCCNPRLWGLFRNDTEKLLCNISTTHHKDLMHAVSKSILECKVYWERFTYASLLKTISCTELVSVQGPNQPQCRPLVWEWDSTCSTPHPRSGEGGQAWGPGPTGMCAESEGVEWAWCVEQAVLHPVRIQDVYICNLPAKREADACAGSHRRQHYGTQVKEALLLPENYSLKERCAAVVWVKAGTVQVAAESSKGQRV